MKRTYNTPNLPVWCLSPKPCQVYELKNPLASSSLTFLVRTGQEFGEKHSAFIANFRPDTENFDRKMLIILPTKEIKVFHSSISNCFSLHASVAPYRVKRVIFWAGYFSAKQPSNHVFIDKYAVPIQHCDHLGYLNTVSHSLASKIYYGSR